MSIIRVKKNQNYTVIKNTILEDERLSWRARGIAAYLLSKGDGWSISRDHVWKTGIEGRDAVTKAMKELEDSGYLHRVKSQNEKGQWSTELVLTEEPSTEEVAPIDDELIKDATKPTPQEPATDRLKTSHRQTENRLLGSPTTGFQSAISKYCISNTDSKKDYGEDSIPPIMEALPPKQPDQSLSLSKENEYLPGMPMPKYKRNQDKQASKADAVKARLPLVEKLIDIWAVRVLTDDPDYDGSELGECHRVAEKLLRDGETANSLDVHYKAYLADEWRNTPVSPSAFARFIAQSKQTIKQATVTPSVPTFKQWCLKHYHTDMPQIALGLSESQLRSEYEQSIRVH